MEPLSATPAGPRMCICVKSHNPKLHLDEAEAHHVWPLGEGGPDVRENLRWLCPTTHTKVHNLWRQYVRFQGKVPRSIKSRYSPYVQDLVSEGWAKKEAAERVRG